MYSGDYRRAHLYMWVEMGVITTGCTVQQQFPSCIHTTYSITENTTRKNNIIVYTDNKLCETAEMHRNNGKNVKCPTHQGHCSADLETRWFYWGWSQRMRQCCRDINSQGLLISHITLDRDSRASVGMNSQSLECEQLSDSVHLSLSQKRQVNKTEFSENILHGGTKAERMLSKCWFTADLSKCGSAEFTGASKTCRRDD